MRIVVPIKQVPETTAVKMDEKTGTMVREGVEAIVNPLDLYAIEAAIGLRELHGGEVVVVSMGPPKAATAIREAVSMGCDTGILVSDKAFAGGDTWATSHVLAAACRQIGLDGIDLIICGERATDGDTGQVGPGLAAWLDWPVVAYVGQIASVDPAARTATVHRLVEDGHEILEVDLPAVLTVVKEIGDPRLPTLRGKQKARRMEIPTWGRDDLGLTEDTCGLAGSPTRVVRIFRPQVARQCEKVTAADPSAVAEAVDRLVAYLEDKDLLQGGPSERRQ